MTKRTIRRIIAAATLLVATAATLVAVTTANAATTSSSYTWCTYRVTGNGVAVRKKPNRSAPRRGLMYKGQWFDGIYGENINGYKIGYKRSDPNRVYGWISAKYLQRVTSRKCWRS